jgi:hypothetical protein
VDETPLVSGGDTGANDGGRRQMVLGHHRELEVMDRLRDEDPVERQDDTVVVLDVRRQMIVVRDRSVVVVLEVRVRDHLMVPVRPVRPVYVLRRRERQDRQRRHETHRERARDEHYVDATGSACRATTEESLTGLSESAAASRRTHGPGPRIET